MVDNASPNDERLKRFYGSVISPQIAENATFAVFGHTVNLVAQTFLFGQDVTACMKSIRKLVLSD